MNIGENFLMVDIDIRNACQASSQTDASDVETFDSSDVPKFSKIVEDIIFDGIPHFLIFHLNFAVGAGVLINNLD